MEKAQTPLINLHWDKKPKEDSVLLYDPNGTFVCQINSSIDFAWARLQIAKEKWKGCYIVWKDGRSYEIEPDGSIKNWPNGLYSDYVMLLTRLAKSRLSDEAASKSSIPDSDLIDINKCPRNPYVDIYDNQDKLICHTNDDLQFKWVCAQIKLNKLHGCYIIFRDQKIMINEYGCPVENPLDMFEYYTDQLIALV